MKISNKSRYGAKILVDLARHKEDEPVRMGEISQRQDISVKYLEQLILPLKKANLIRSIRGAKGGHMLAQHPEDITMGQIVRLFESQNESDTCFCNEEKCTISATCTLRFIWQQAIKAFYDKLESTSIADIVEKCII
jgi:Rrf2 family iron-sulfur cluster assembly transcriptional regulator